MELNGRRHLPIDRPTAWAALKDPEVLKDCIPGCQSVERVADNEYRMTMGAALGPVRATFRGKLRIEDEVPAESYTLKFDGEGGVAGFAKGEAKVRLVDDAGTRLDYAVTSQVGGKIAQVGNRLVDAAAKKIAEEFFVAFEKRVTPVPGTAPAPAAAHAPHPPRDMGSPLYWIAFAALMILAVLGYVNRG
jgi:carbon monoxide dehydrogenase subunit G